MNAENFEGNPVGGALFGYAMILMAGLLAMIVYGVFSLLGFLIWPIKDYLFAATCWGVIVYTTFKMFKTVLRKEREVECQKEWGNAPSLSATQITRCLFLVLAVNGVAYLHGSSDYTVRVSAVISAVLLFYIFLRRSEASNRDQYLREMAGSMMWEVKEEILKIIDQSKDMAKTSISLIDVLKSQSLVPLPGEETMRKRWSEVRQDLSKRRCNYGPWQRGYGENDNSYFGRTEYYKVCGIMYGLDKDGIKKDEMGWWCKELVGDVIGYGIWHDNIAYPNYKGEGWIYFGVEGIVEYLSLLTTIRDALKKEVPC